MSIPSLHLRAYFSFTELVKNHRSWSEILTKFLQQTRCYKVYRCLTSFLQLSEAAPAKHYSKQTELNFPIVPFQQTASVIKMYVFFVFKKNKVSKQKTIIFVVLQRFMCQKKKKYHTSYLAEACFRGAGALQWITA